jgi:hypothetical protein
MGKLEDALKLENLDPEAKGELKDTKDKIVELEAIKQVAMSEGGAKLLTMLKEDSRDLLLQLLTSYREAPREELVGLISSFEAKYTLYNHIKSAESDLKDEKERADIRVDEILEG